ncbi:uncharacterized protein MYCFIDRAFT_212746 [Pseudocercospora fijiensis CIRAD86]|uniref:CFEM domain-containing protein n=1 Tax=Pseudocercospora fijiensis (strain CIRAD86) TaxID=383855 RepID=M3AHC2_PSEFD|nr:uncharacterized protein MYCFIDRAFT_212746 [Pseudocercospora fijiensis CIRAD86]EME76902.1 hypothetical protein MYCFIDRAFT_212746 [Pseudocercospora fijiensis CIRAD86]
MHAIYTSIFTLAAFAVAQDLTDTTQAIKLIPACAISCFTQGITATTCGPTDVHCQCTTGAADVAKVVIPCLCNAMADKTCSSDELMKAADATTKICTAALAAKGETFKSTSLDPSMCKSLNSAVGGSTPSSTATAKATSTASSKATSTPSPTAGHSGGNATSGHNDTTSGHAGNSTSTSKKGSAPAVAAFESFKLLISCGMLGLAGVAWMAL